MGARVSILIRPIGRVASTRKAPIDDGWDRVRSRILLDRRFPPSALRGLSAFSHVLVVFWMDRVDPGKVQRGLRRPRDNPRWPAVGVFAHRGKERPNPIGVTVCRILGIRGRVLRVAGLDAIEGTPVLDLKPWIRGFSARGAVREPRWAREIMRRYWQ